MEWRKHTTEGLCEKCAYPVGVSSVCTKCGKAVARNQPRP
jgi:hypothetical protein